MAQVRLGDTCPLCGNYIRQLPVHLPECSKREATLRELEDRAAAIRRSR